MIFVTVFAVASLLAIIWAWKLDRDDRRRKKFVCKVASAFYDCCAVDWLTLTYAEDISARGIEKLIKLLPICVRVDRVYKPLVTEKEFGESSESICLRVIALSKYDFLCKAIQDAQDDVFSAEEKLRDLLPECENVDSEMAEFYGDDLPEGCCCLTSRVQSIIDSGDIGKSVTV